MSSESADVLTMRLIEDFPDQQQKPFLSKASRIDSFLADEVNLQTLLNIALSGPYYFTDTTKSVVGIVSLYYTWKHPG